MTDYKLKELESKARAATKPCPSFPGYFAACADHQKMNAGSK